MANSFGYRWRPPTDRSVFLPRKASANNGADRAFRLPFLEAWKAGTIVELSRLNVLETTIAQAILERRFRIQNVLNGAERLNIWNDWNGIEFV